MHHKLLLAGTFAWLTACSDAQLYDTAAKGSKALDASAQAAPESGDQQGSLGAEAPGGDPTTGAIKAQVEDESVDIPAPIAGAYLSCVYEKAPIDLEPETTKEVFCSVRSRTTKSIIDVYSLSLGIQWGLEVVGYLAPRMAIIPLPGHRQYHVRLLFRELEANDLNQLLTRGLVTVSFQKDAITIARGRSTILPVVYSWLRLDGNSFPAQTFVAGGECNASIPLGICRIARGQALYPGKLTQHYLDGSKTRCLTTDQNQTQILSESIGPPERNLATEVMILPQAEGRASLRWVRSQAGMIPPDALAAGHDEAGKTLYLCRNAERGPAAPGSICTNNPSGEPAPGYIAEGGRGCVHEYFDQQRLHVNDYEVLVLDPP